MSNFKLSDMNYRTKIKALMEQISRTDWDFFEACKTQNRKIFLSIVMPLFAVVIM